MRISSRTEKEWSYTDLSLSISVIWLFWFISVFVENDVPIINRKMSSRHLIIILKYLSYNDWHSTLDKNSMKIIENILITRTTTQYFIDKWSSYFSKQPKRQSIYFFFFELVSIEWIDADLYQKKRTCKNCLLLNTPVISN
jgi:hypothetical protein